jgi:hypothetical protein
MKIENALGPRVQHRQAVGQALTALTCTVDGFGWEVRRGDALGTPAGDSMGSVNPGMGH